MHVWASIPSIFIPYEKRHPFLWKRQSSSQQPRPRWRVTAKSPPLSRRCAAPRRFVAGVCVYVSLLRRTTYFQLSSRTSRFFLAFPLSPGAETFTAYRGTVSRTLIAYHFVFWGIYRVSQRAKLGFELAS